MVEITVDSGAAQVASDYRLMPSLGSRSGATYRTPSGDIFARQGEKRIAMNIEEGDADDVVPDYRVTIKGHRIVLGDDGVDI